MKNHPARGGQKFLNLDSDINVTSVSGRVPGRLTDAWMNMQAASGSFVSTQRIPLSDIACSASFAALIGLSVSLVTGVGSQILTTLLTDISGLLFLVSALFYRGSVRTWWMWFAPVSFALLMAPIAVVEARGYVTSFGDVLRAALVPGLSFLGGNMIATLRDTLRGSDELRRSMGELRSRLHSRSLDLRKLSGEVSRVVHWSPYGDERVHGHASRWSEVEYHLDPYMLDVSGPESTLDQKSLEAVVAAEMDHLAGQITARPKIKLTFIHPREIPVPLAVQGDGAVLHAVLRGLLAQALDALIADEGVIRVSVRPSMTHVAIAIEDNGRGLSEAFILKLQEKGVLPRSNGRWDLRGIRRACEKSGWKFEMFARLGVGARVILELPRVDMFAYNPSPLIRAKIESRGSGEPIPYGGPKVLG